MRDRIEVGGAMPRFWEPRPSRFWRAVCSPMHWRFLWYHRIAWIGIRGLERLDRVPAGDGILICPNHSYTGDGSVAMHLARRMTRPTCMMAAWHVFRGHGGIDGWLLQRQGLFSVDREGCDRRAIRCAIDLLVRGNGLIVFPEGEIYHLNDRLTPLREGVAFMAVSAQKELEKAGSLAHVWVVPAAIRYRFIGNISHKLDKRISQIEKRLLLRPRSGLALHERIINIGDVLLTIKEKEQLGRSYESEGDLPTRIKRLTEHLLSRREQMHLGRTNPDESVPVRVKLLRKKLLECACEENAAEPLPQVREALADVHLALQLYSYPGDYISSHPAPARMAETLEKFEEDMDSVEATPLAWRRAKVIIGEPIIVRPVLGGSARSAASELTARIEHELAEMIRIE